MDFDQINRLNRKSYDPYCGTIKRAAVYAISMGMFPFRKCLNTTRKKISAAGLYVGLPKAESYITPLPLRRFHRITIHLPSLLRMAMKMSERRAVNLILTNPLCPSLAPQASV